MNYFVNVKKQDGGVLIFEVMNGYTLQVIFATNNFAEAQAKCDELNFSSRSFRW